MVKTPRWENLMPLYFEILAKKPKGKAQQELLDLVKEECMRAARMMDRSVDYEVMPSQSPSIDPDAVKPRVPFNYDILLNPFSGLREFDVRPDI